MVPQFQPFLLHFGKVQMTDVLTPDIFTAHVFYTVVQLNQCSCREIMTKNADNFKEYF